MEFVKHDKDKPATHLLPTVALESISEVLAFGAKKYAPNGWRSVDNRSRYYGAILRHAFAWNGGENLDKDSGLPHLAHLACSALFLLEAELSGLGVDDRPTAKPMTGPTTHGDVCGVLVEQGAGTPPRRCIRVSHHHGPCGVVER